MALPSHWGDGSGNKHVILADQPQCHLDMRHEDDGNGASDDNDDNFTAIIIELGLNPQCMTTFMYVPPRTK